MLMFHRPCEACKKNEEIREQQSIGALFAADKTTQSR